MKILKKAAAAIGLVGALALVGACGTEDATTPTSSHHSSSPHSSSAHPSHSSAPAPEGDGTPSTTPHTNPPHTNPPQTAPSHSPAARDDDPGGKPCTDQSGAPGHYVWDQSGNQWICEITGDAPRAGGHAPASQTPAARDNGGDPGGSPCTNQSGAHGTYIWSDSTNQWVCKIS